MGYALADEFLTTAWGPIQVKACGKVACDLGLGGGFSGYSG